MAPSIPPLLLTSIASLYLLSPSANGLRFGNIFRSRPEMYSSSRQGTSTAGSSAGIAPPRTWAPWQANAKSTKDNLPIDSNSSNRMFSSTMEGAAAVAESEFNLDSTSGAEGLLSNEVEDFVGRKEPNASAYWSLLRPHNIPSSFGLVAAGALVASHSVLSLLDVKVVFTAIAAASISVGSCVLNDWFDVELDRVNKLDRPLVTGEVIPQHALAIGLAFLVVAVVSASAVHPAALQATIVASVALTSAYTPLLKPVPLVKNFVVAGVIAAAIASGGLAAGAGVTSTITPTCLTFFVIAHREILMDISDVEGDAEAGVRTLPVLLGREASLAIASMLLTAGVGGAGFGILSSASTAASRSLATGLCALFTMPLYANIARVGKSDFSADSLHTAVEQALGPLALVLGLMGFALR